MYLLVIDRSEMRLSRLSTNKQRTKRRGCLDSEIQALFNFINNIEAAAMFSMLIKSIANRLP